MAGTFAFASACSDDSGGGGGGGGGGSATDFLGIISTDDGLESAEISITLDTGSPSVAGAASITAFASVGASGSHKLDGAAVNMTGTYDDQTKIVALSGGGYTMGGGYDPASGRLEGAFSGGGKSGTFVTTKKGNATVAYCGTFTGDDDGTFSFVINNQNELLGNAYAIGNVAPIPLDGTKSGNSITIVHPLGGATPLATGTISGNNVSGAWDDGNGNSGTWSGSVCP